LEVDSAVTRARKRHSALSRHKGRMC
jgi:hypothetical protein